MQGPPGQEGEKGMKGEDGVGIPGRTGPPVSQTSSRTANTISVIKGCNFSLVESDARTLEHISLVVDSSLADTIMFYTIYFQCIDSYLKDTIIHID